MRSQSGVRKDGTELDSPFYAATVWTRFQRGKPRKIGGYARLSGQLNAPIHSVFVATRNGLNTAHYLGKWGIQRQVLSGISATGLVDRTPAGFVAGDDYSWSQSLIYSTTGGSYAALVASAAVDLNDISSDVGGNVYAGDIAGTDRFTTVSDGSGPILVSGGVTVLQPFVVVYGSDGLIRNSNPNDFSASTGWTTGSGNYSNSANVAGTKFVYGAPVRGGGQSPAGLFWALDSLVRMSFEGGTRIWAFDTISHPTSILSKRCVVEHDGKFFWIGTTRFLFYNGIVQELPNQMNCNDFFENLNYNQRNKVWGTKVDRFGEIWWFYPRGTDTDCNNAIIFNYLENTWYEAACQRSAGHTVQNYVNPVWVGDEDATDTWVLPIGVNLALSAQTLTGSNVLTFATDPALSGAVVGHLVTGAAGIPPGTTVLVVGALTVTMSAVATADIPTDTLITFSSMTTPFVAGQTVTGGTSGATALVERVSESALNVVNVAGTFGAAEVLTGGGGAAADTLGLGYEQTLTSVYKHEYGYDKISGQNVFAIPASFNTCNFGIAVGDPFGDAPQTFSSMTRVTRIEPDFDQVGELTLTVLGKSYAKQDYKALKAYPITADTIFLDPRVQERILQIQVSSNVVGGFYQLGQTLVGIEPGDERGNL